MANPELRPYMQFYPEQSDKGTSQLWHGRKWLLDAPDDSLTPMVSVGKKGEEKHFYVNELLQLQDGKLFVPTRFFYDESGGCKTLRAMGHDAVMTPVSVSNRAPSCNPR